MGSNGVCTSAFLTTPILLVGEHTLKTTDQVDQRAPGRAVGLRKEQGERCEELVVRNL